MSEDETPRESTDDRIAAIRARWEAAPPAPWRWDDDPETGVLRLWFLADAENPPNGYAPTIACAFFAGDMETYEGADLRLAATLSEAPADVAYLLDEVDQLRGERDRLVAQLLRPWR